MPRKSKPHIQRYERKADEPAAITPIEYGGLQDAYDHFNRVLFDGTLPDVFITYQRKANSAGYFSPDRYSGRLGHSGKHELALNPDGFIGQSDEQVSQTLVHEMTHTWQHAHGAPSKRGYHNKEWAEKMKAIGLQPSNTGMVGGKETGQRMSDYPISGGPFTQAFATLAATGWKLNLQSAHRAGGKKRPSNSKVKFTCPSCGWNAWAKPDSDLVHKRCGLDMLAEGVNADGAAVPSYDPSTAVLLDVLPSHEPTPEPEPVKLKRGRPKGSKNKPKVLARSYDGKPRNPRRQSQAPL